MYGKRWVGLAVLALVLAGGRIARSQELPESVYAKYATRQPPKRFLDRDVTRIPFRSFVQEYADSLKFDGVYGAADSQHVDFRRGGRIGSGPWAVIEPEEGAWALDSNQLAEGRVIARIKTDSTVDSLGYNSREWTYWWVDKRGPADSSGQPTWRALFFSRLLENRAKVSKMQHHGYHGHYWRQSVARWKGSQWGSCDRASCCIKE